MLRSKLARLGVAVALSSGGAIGTAVVSSTVQATAAHAAAACVQIPNPQDPDFVATDVLGLEGLNDWGVFVGECANTDDSAIFAVTIEAGETDEPTCDGAVQPVDLETGATTGVDVCVAGAVGVSAEATGLGGTSPGGELEVCTLVVGCSGIESDAPSGGEG